MGDEYLNYFHDFINAKLPDYETTFTAKDMISWVKSRTNKTPKNIIEHLLKRTTNYPCRNINSPKSYPQDDLFVLANISSIRSSQLSLSGRPEFVKLLQDSDSIFFKSHQSSNAVKAKANLIAERRKRNEREKKVDYEEKLEHYLETNLEKVEVGLQLWNGKSGIRCKIGNAGFVDFLCIDREGDFVAIELKRDDASSAALTQLQRYMEGIKSEFAASHQKVRGIIIARSVDKLRTSIISHPDIELFEYEMLINAGETSLALKKIT